MNTLRKQNITCNSTSLSNFFYNLFSRDSKRKQSNLISKNKIKNIQIILCVLSSINLINFINSINLINLINTTEVYSKKFAQNIG